MRCGQGSAAMPAAAATRTCVSGDFSLSGAVGARGGDCHGRVGHKKLPPIASIAASTAVEHHRQLGSGAGRQKLRRDVARSRRFTGRPVEALARGAHMSAGHLSREFRLAYGEAPYGYLMTRRIERAMALLRRGDLSVTEVCFEVGYSSLGAFSTRFTDLVGMPPSAYRRDAA